MIERFDPPGGVLVADMGAGREHLSWAGGTLRHVDVLLVVTDATRKALVTAAKVQQLASDLGIVDIAVVANRVADGDGALVRRFCDAEGLEVVGAVPDDPMVRRAEREGFCVLDRPDDTPTVRAVDALRRVLDQRLSDAG